MAATGAGSLFTLSLAAGALTLTANPGALGQLASHAPVTVDIPIETAAARAESGTFAPISSCVAADMVPSAKILVGTGATLHLYSPDTTEPTGVAVVPNAPGRVLPAPPAPGHLAVRPSGLLLLEKLSCSHHVVPGDG